MARNEVLTVDLGQSGTRIKQGERLMLSDRGKLASEMPLPALRIVFEGIDKLSAQVVALSCSGFNGVVTEPEKYGELCTEFFGATKVAVIDDGFAGYIGALDGGEGVVLTVGGGVVCIGGNNGIYSHRDGLGSTFGDEGGGFWLGKMAITKALAIRQGRADDQKMMEFFATECIDYDNLAIKDGAAAATLAINTAKKVLAAADEGVSTAIAIVDEGAYLLAQTVIATWFGVSGKESDSPEVVIQGGIARNASYVTKIGLQMKAKLPFAVVVPAVGDNLAGANWIARNMRSDIPPLLLWSGL